MFSVDASNMEKTLMNLDQGPIHHQTVIAADEIANETEKHTHPYVPEEEHYLVGGFKEKVTSYPPLFRMDMIYDAVSNQGYHYAAIQHEEKLDHFKKPPKKFIKPGAKDHYLLIGFGEVPIEAIWARHLHSVL